MDAGRLPHEEVNVVSGDLVAPSIVELAESGITVWAAPGRRWRWADDHVGFMQHGQHGLCLALSPTVVGGHRSYALVCVGGLVGWCVASYLTRVA